MEACSLTFVMYALLGTSIGLIASTIFKLLSKTLKNQPNKLAHFIAVIIISLFSFLFYKFSEVETLYSLTAGFFSIIGSLLIFLIVYLIKKAGKTQNGQKPVFYFIYCFSV
jgi:chromate transport protein ChrA